MWRFYETSTILYCLYPASYQPHPPFRRPRLVPEACRGHPADPPTPKPTLPNTLFLFPMADAAPTAKPPNADDVAERPGADGSGVMQGAAASDAATSPPMVGLSADGGDGEFAEFDFGAKLPC